MEQLSITTHVYKPEELTARCECHTPEHTIFFDYDGEEGDLYMTIHLSCNHRGFWKRLWYGIKYAFGYKSRFGEWEEVIIRPVDCEKIKELLDKRLNYPIKSIREALKRLEGEQVDICSTSCLPVPPSNPPPISQEPSQKP